MNRRQFLAVVAVACAVFGAGCAGNERASQVKTVSLSPDEGATYEYVVPFGTGRLLDRGGVIEIMPQTLQVRVGESIRITNEDISGIEVGPFFVAALQTLAMRFTHVGTLSGVCLLNPEGEFVIKVTE